MAWSSTSSSTTSQSYSYWGSMKALGAIVESTVVRKTPGIRHDLEAALRKHKPQFIALLKNPSRSPKDADLVRKAQTEGIKFTSPSRSDPSGQMVAAAASDTVSYSVQKISPQTVDETLILAEMFGLNEIAALQLLLKGEEKMSMHPGLTRGLVAVLLYYDGRKSLVQALRMLIEAREGLTWTQDLQPDITEAVTQFTGLLLEEGLVDKILNLLNTLDWDKEVMELQKNMALGDARHRRQVRDLFFDIRQGLADCVFAFAAQSGLPRQDTLRLIDYLSKVKPGDSDGQGVVQKTTLTLVMALMYAIDFSAISKFDDENSITQELHIVKDPSFITSMHRELGPACSRQWENIALKSLAHFTWAMSVAAMRSLPHHRSAQAVVEDDEAVMDLALEDRIFHHLPSCILASDSLGTEEYYLRRLHQLLTDFLVLMPMKVKELRNRADDAARNELMHEQEGIHYIVPVSGQHFDFLLRSITCLYSTDKLKLDLVLDYWCPSEGNSSGGGSIMERYPQRQVSLYKFVRLAGDLLMPPLYVPYLNLLISLSDHPQSAHHCFNLLKLNGIGSGGGANTVSWDHFFSSLQQYFANLRQELTPQQQMLPSSDTIYHVGRPLTRGISPAEILGLMSVLKLVQTVASNCEAARVAMAENTNWQPLLVIVGLLGCAVPTQLKADLLKTLGALAKSPEVAYSVWQNAETAQLIASTTTSTSATAPKTGLNVELENVETRNEAYPMTKAFLKLIDILTDSGIPSSLGAGTRVPGFEPYLAFIRDSIFLRFNTRAYRDPGEKWAVAGECLNIFKKILDDYYPQAVDFAKKHSTGVDHQTVGKHPGFFIMVDLQQSSELLRLLLFILDEGCLHMESYQEFPGKSHLERSCLLVLQILDLGLGQQSVFLDAAKTANTSLLLTPLDQLLQGVNPRSGRPDHMLNVCKFVTFSWWLPACSLHAIRILSFVAQSPSAQPGLLSALRPTEAIGQTIVKGFTDILDSDDDEQSEGSSELSSARLAVVQLLLSGLDKPSPSLAHFLLGFDLKRGVSRSTIQPPGVMGAIRTPLHAALSLLHPIDAKTSSSALRTAPQLCEAAYKLIYHLCANGQTSEPTLRYLRSSEEFLATQLSLLPLPEDVENFVYATKGISWLLKTVAIELKQVCTTRLRSQVALLIHLLLDTDANSGAGSAEDSIVLQRAEETSLAQLSRSMAVSGSNRMGSSVQAGTGQRQHRLLQLLNSIGFEEERLDVPDWEVFDSAQVSQVLKSCEKVGLHGEKVVDIQKLHKILNDELVRLQGAAAMNQRLLIQSEIKSILTYAVQWNALQDRSITKRNILDAWRQVTEVLLCSVPGDLLPADSKQQLLLDLLQTLLNKVLADRTMPELANQVSGVVLLLITALRQTYSSDGSGSSATIAKGADYYVSILDSSSSQLSGAGGSDVARKSSVVYSTALHVVLKSLVHWVGNTSSSAQRVRSNLYGALLNYLRIGRDTLDSSLSTDADKFRKVNLDILLDFGEHLLDTLCRDTVSGHDIRRMLALSALDELVHLDSRGSWTHYMSNQGYLRNLIESMAVEDEQLISLLSPTDFTLEDLNMRALYTYESKMALLTRLASTASGASLLLESSLTARLAEMAVFSARPDVDQELMMMEQDSYEEDSGFMLSSPLARYHQILFPALRLCQALLASLGAANRSAAAQVRHFLAANEELARSVLRWRPGSMSLAHLREMSLFTGLVSRCMSGDGQASDTTKPSDLQNAANVTRMQQMMLSLIPHCSLGKDQLRQLKAGVPESHYPKAFTLLLEVVANVLVFARNVMSGGGFAGGGSRFCQVVFAPSLKEANVGEDEGYTQPTVVFPNRPPSLGHLLILLRNLCSHLLTNHAAISDLVDKLQAVDRLSSGELAELLSHESSGASANLGRFNAAEKRARAERRIQVLLERRRHEEMLTGTAVESAALMVLRHLEFFLLYANEDAPANSYQRSHRKLIDEPVPAEVSGLTNVLFQDAVVPVEAVRTLKEETRSCFSESFYVKLEDVEKIYSQPREGNFDRFLDVVIRRLKRISSVHA